MFIARVCSPSALDGTGTANGHESLNRHQQTEWAKRMTKEPFGAAKKKKMTVAIARRFAVDWWRINTGQIQPEDVGLKVAYPSAYATRALRAGRIAKVYAKTA